MFRIFPLMKLVGNGMTKIKTNGKSKVRLPLENETDFEFLRRLIRMDQSKSDEV